MNAVPDARRQARWCQAPQAAVHPLAGAYGAKPRILQIEYSARCTRVAAAAVVQETLPRNGPRDSRLGMSELAVVSTRVHALQHAVEAKVAVIIPCHRTSSHILGVLGDIGPSIWRIYVVDDCCPERTGDLVETHCPDPRVRVIRHPHNRGVGAAVVSGYRSALHDGADILVKLDGDGQMDPALINTLIKPVVRGFADYAKGNRFFEPAGLSRMPPLRLFGNAVLSFMNKASTGYWDIMDPTNGFTCVHAKVASQVLRTPLSERYFFESDMLFRLGTLRAVVCDVPMEARYGDETSGLRIGRIIPEFLRKHFTNTCKRLIYGYVIRDFSMATIEFLLASALLTFGAIFGGIKWHQSIVTNIPVPDGTVMLAALPVVIGCQLMLAAIGFDIANLPRQPLQHKL